MAFNDIHVKHLKSSPYHPATNGLVECFIQTLKQALRVLKRDGHTAAQPGQLLIELPKRKTTFHRSHTGIIDDGEGSTCTLQTQSNVFLMLETELLEITGLVILGGNQPE